MVTAFLYVMAGVVVCTPLDPPPAGTDAATNHEMMYRQGRTFAEFLAAAESRKEGWHTHYDEGRVPAELLARARAVPGRWYILAVAEDWCGDSVNTIPYLARLVEQVEGLEMRIVNSEVGRPIMQAHLTPDGREATPTVLLLDDRFDEVGCWVERPSELQAWWLDNEPKVERRELLGQKYDWYDQDAGETTIAEIVMIMEVAASGSSLCK